MANTLSTVTKKPWGQEELLEINSKYLFKRLLMRKGHRCSYQYHRFKRETVYCLQGTLSIIMQNITINLKPGEYLTINPRERHRMHAATGDVVYLEASTSHPKDVVRLEDDYQRS